MVKLQLPKLAMRVRFPLLAPNRKGAIRHPFCLEKVMNARNRRKLPVTFSPALSRCSLLPSLLGGVQIPVTRSKQKGCRMAPFLFGVSNRCENSPQAASNFLLSTLSVQLVARLCREG